MGKAGRHGGAVICQLKKKKGGPCDRLFLCNQDSDLPVNCSALTR